MADACVHIMEKNSFNEIVEGQDEVRNTHINIGTGEDVSIKELAEKIKKEVGFKGKLSFDFSKPDGTPRKLTDVSKLKELGWRYSITLDEGISKLYSWYLENA